MSDHLKMPVHEEWSCGHIATAMCAECYQELIQRANALAAENERLRTPPACGSRQMAMGDVIGDCDICSSLQAEIDRLRAFAESVRNWKRLPLWELTDTDRERAVAFRRQLEIHAEMAREALEGNAGRQVAFSA